MSTGNRQRHTVTHADNVFVGSAQYNAYQGGKRGIEWPHIVPVEFGQVDTLDADGIVVAQTATGAATLSASGALVSGGVATFDVARCPSITSTGNLSGVTFTFAGRDTYGEALVASRAGPNNGTVVAAKAFKEIDTVAVSGAVAAAVNVGMSDTLGLPFRLPDVGKFLGLSISGDPVPSTPVAGMAATGASTATTADVRGTVLATTAANGSLYFTAMMVVDHTSKAKAFGTAQFGG
jgi:hypothetical protein